MISNHTIEWQFGGWEAFPPWAGWGILLLLAMGGVALSAWFYRDTLRALTWRQSLIFATLRSGFYLSLLVCLAGPAQVERIYDQGQDSRPLAVVIDRSQSMSVADSRGLTRLADALRVWKDVEGNAVHAFSSFHYFRFDKTLQSAPDLENAIKGTDSDGNETHLYDSLNQVLKDAPPGGYGGIVSLTDGLDTTNVTSEELATRALQNHSPLYFCAGQTKQVPAESLLVREISVPGQVPRKTRFSTTILVEAHAIADHDVPLVLTEEGRTVAQTSIRLHQGPNLVPWTVPLEAGEPGLIHLACCLGEGAEQESTAATIPVVGEDKAHILFYQGSLDWSFRFINSALNRDPNFVITGLFNPGLNMAQIVAPAGQPSLSELPAAVDKLNPYQVVVLSNAFGDELTSEQQAALLGYVHRGGGLLFLISDTRMAQTFSGTDLESVLPVIFEAPPRPNDHDNSLQQFQEMMHSIGGSNPDQETTFTDEALNQPQPDPLQPFVLPADHTSSTATALFGGADGSAALPAMPQFISYAQVHGVKAGAEILAIHPQDKTAANAPRALIVTQRYGQGRVTAFLTDSLWRWRMSLPSTSHAPEIFWQQLFLSLVHRESGTQGLRFGAQPFSSSLGQACAFRLDNATGAPVISTIAPSGASQPVTVQAAAQPGSWSFKLNPNEAGKWRVRAQDDRGAMVETLLRVSHVSHAVELSGLPPDVEGLRRLAQSTGGSLLNDGAPDSWSVAAAPNLNSLVGKHSRPLWNNWWVLLLGLGLYVTELIGRRFAKLL